MLPTRVMWLRIRELVGGNVLTIGADDPDAPHLFAIIAPYTDNPNLVAADLTFGPTQFQWSFLAADGSIDLGEDAISQAASWQRIDAGRPWTWKASSVGLPVTLYGVALVSNDGATLYATEQLPDPVTFDRINQETDSPRMRLQYPRDLVR